VELERDQVIQVGRLRGIEKFEGEIENFILNTLIYFKPVEI